MGQHHLCNRSLCNGYLENGIFRETGCIHYFGVFVFCTSWFVDEEKSKKHLFLYILVKDLANFVTVNGTWVQNLCSKHDAEFLKI